MLGHFFNSVLLFIHKSLVQWWLFSWRKTYCLPSKFGQTNCKQKGSFFRHYRIVPLSFHNVCGLCTKPLTTRSVTWDQDQKKRSIMKSTRTPGLVSERFWMSLVYYLYVPKFIYSEKATITKRNLQSFLLFFRSTTNKRISWLYP